MQQSADWNSHEPHGLSLRHKDSMIFIVKFMKSASSLSFLVANLMNFRPKFAARNGVYVNVVEKVREAFKTEEVVRLDCSYVETSDSKKIGVKLRVRKRSSLRRSLLIFPSG